MVFPLVVVVLCMVGERPLLAMEPERSVLGHPTQFSLVVTQFPLGMDEDYFPLPALPILAEERLKRARLPVVPRTSDKPAPPYLRISVVGIRQKGGYVLLVQADLRETAPATCNSGPPLEVSTWQYRQWSTTKDGGPPPAEEVWRSVDRLLTDFVAHYTGKK